MSARGAALRPAELRWGLGVLGELLGPRRYLRGFLRRRAGAVHVAPGATLSWGGQRGGGRAPGCSPGSCPPGAGLWRRALPAALGAGRAGARSVGTGRVRTRSCGLPAVGRPTGLLGGTVRAAATPVPVQGQDPAPEPGGKRLELPRYPRRPGRAGAASLPQFLLARPMSAAGAAPRGGHFALVGLSPRVGQGQGGWLEAGTRSALRDTLPTAVPRPAWVRVPLEAPRGRAGGPLTVPLPRREPHTVIVKSPAGRRSPRGSREGTASLQTSSVSVVLPRRRQLVGQEGRPDGCGGLIGAQIAQGTPLALPLSSVHTLSPSSLHQAGAGGVPVPSLLFLPSFPLQVLRLQPRSLGAAAFSSRCSAACAAMKGSPVPPPPVPHCWWRRTGPCLRYSLPQEHPLHSQPGTGQGRQHCPSPASPVCQDGGAKWAPLLCRALSWSGQEERGALHHPTEPLGFSLCAPTIGCCQTPPA